MKKLQKISAFMLVFSMLFVLTFTSVKVSANPFIENDISFNTGQEAPDVNSQEFIDNDISADLGQNSGTPATPNTSVAMGEFIANDISVNLDAEFIEPNYNSGGNNNSNNGGNSNNPGSPIYNNSDVTNYYGDINYNEITNYYNQNYNYDINPQDVDNFTLTGDITVQDSYNNQQPLDSSSPNQPEAPTYNYNYNYSYDYTYDYNSRRYLDYDYYYDYYNYPIYSRTYARNYTAPSYSRAYYNSFPETCQSYIKDISRVGNRVKFTVQNPFTKETVAVFTVDI